MCRANPGALPRLDAHGRAGLPGRGQPGPQAARAALQADAPQRLGDYLLLRPIGSGRMGVVYEAIQESLGRHVALKTLPFHQLSDPTQLERFPREARAAARLHHTHIVPVFGVGEHDGLHYYAMQFIRGHGLDAILNEVKRLRGEPGQPGAAGAPAGDHSTATLAFQLGYLRRRLGHSDEALLCYGEALPLQEAAHRAQPGLTEATDGLAWTYNNLGHLQQIKGRLSEALQSYDRAVHHRRQLVNSDPVAIRWREILAQSYLSLGTMKRFEGDTAGALDAINQAVAISESLVLEHAGDRDLEQQLAEGRSFRAELLLLFGATAMRSNWPGARPAMTNTFTASIPPWSAPERTSRTRAWSWAMPSVLLATRSRLSIRTIAPGRCWSH